MDESSPLCVGRWQLTVVPKSLTSSILSFIGRLAIDTPSVFVMDGGNQFNVVEIAEAVNGNEEILERIQGSRAFTCYQMESLLATTTLTNTTIVALDFLSTFYDQSVPFADRSRLLNTCLTHIRRLSQTNGVFVIAHPPAIPSPQATNLINRLESSADEIFPPELLIREPDMGKTVPTFTQIFDTIQASFSKFRRALRQPDQLVMDTLFAFARKHLTPGALAERPLFFETILFCMLIEQQKEIEKLRQLIQEGKLHRE